MKQATQMVSRTPGRSVGMLAACGSVGILVASCMLAACGSSGSASKSPAEQGSTKFPLTITASNGPVVIKAKPTKIVSLSPTATEDLFADKAGPQVVAVDDQSNYPANVPKSKLSGFTPNAEAIAGYKPDLVVISNDTAGIVAALGKLQIPVLVEPAANNMDDVYAQINDLGRATGHAGDANSIATGTRNEIDAAFASVKKQPPPLSVYHEVDNTLYSVTSKTFIGTIYGRAGLTNIADVADKTGSGYPQLSNEYVISANPQLIFLADTKCCGQSLAVVAQRPGWQNVAAVKSGSVIPLDDDIASRWGPRTANLVHSVVDAVNQYH